MKNLKTLKDLEYTALKSEAKDKSIPTEDCLLVRATDLKQEAIKWVKHYKFNEKISNVSKPYFHGCWETLMEFFNITKEDLK